MKKIIITFIVIVGIILMGLLIFGTNKETFKDIKASELDSFMEDNPTYQYIDVRTKSEYNSGHIEGFKNIENKTILNGDASIDVKTPVVVLGKSGYRSQEVAYYLNKNGYEVINVEDGIKNYQGDVIK